MFVAFSSLKEQDNPLPVVPQRYSYLQILDFSLHINIVTQQHLVQLSCHIPLCKIPNFVLSVLPLGFSSSLQSHYCGCAYNNKSLQSLRYPLEEENVL